MFLASCERTDILDTPKKTSNELNTWQEENDKHIPNVEQLLGNIKVVEGKLAFLDENHFMNVMKHLEQAVELHNEKFESENPNLSPEELDEREDQIGFNPVQPLLDFEQRFNFSSRREFIEEKIVKWLDNEILDDENDPDDLDMLEEEERTLLNARGEVIIQGTLRNLIEETQDEESRSGSCYRVKAQSQYYYYGESGNRRFKMKVSARKVPVVSYASIKTKVIHYKKRGNRWKRRRAQIEVRIQGEFHDINCSYQRSGANSRGPKNRRRLFTLYVHNTTLFVHRFQNGKVRGTAIVNGVTRSITLN